MKLAYGSIQVGRLVWLGSIKSAYFGPRLSRSLGSKNLWRNLKSIVFSNTTVPAFTASDFNNYISTYIPTSAQPSYSSTQSTDQFHSFSEFSFASVSDYEVVVALSKVTSNSVGVDNIPIKFIKFLLPVILPYITHIF